MARQSPSLTIAFMPTYSRPMANSHYPAILDIACPVYMKIHKAVTIVYTL